MVRYPSSKVIAGAAATLFGCVIISSPVAAQTHCKDVSGMSQQEIRIAKLQLRAESAQLDQREISGYSSLAANEGQEQYQEIIRRDLNGYAPPMTFEIERTDTSALLCASPFQS